MKSTSENDGRPTFAQPTRSVTVTALASVKRHRSPSVAKLTFWNFDPCAAAAPTPEGAPMRDISRVRVGPHPTRGLRGTTHTWHTTLFVPSAANIAISMFFGASYSVVCRSKRARVIPLLIQSSTCITPSGREKKCQNQIVEASKRYQIGCHRHSTDCSSISTSPVARQNELKRKLRKALEDGNDASRWARIE